MNLIKYRPDIDGLRALAVVPVVLFHFGLGCPGGYVGVDVFFVISGYLITRLILKGFQAGDFSILEFWERRIRRIFPALYVMVFASIVAGYFLLLPWDFEELGRSVTMQSLFSSNFHFWSQSGYFDGPAEMKPLLHTWSLAVEEQFYFIFPALLTLLFKRCRKYLYTILCVICVLSFISSVVGVYHYPYATFYLLPMRAWELLCGALLALRMNRSVGVGGMHQFAALLGVSLIAYACVSFDASTRFPGAAALLPCLGATLFIWSNEGGMTWVGRLFALKPVVFVGLISYSLYLWHWPIVAYMNRMLSGEPELWMSLAMVALSFVLAVISWRYVERPFRTVNLFTRRSSVFKFGAIVSLVAIAAGTALDGVDGAPGRVSEEVLSLGKQKRDSEFRNKNALQDALAGKFQTFGAEVVTEETPKFMIWGDSHGIFVTPELDRLAEECGYAGYAALLPSTPPLLGGWVETNKNGKQIVAYNEAVYRFIESEGIDRVFLAARWAAYHSGRGDDTDLGLMTSEDTFEMGSSGAAQAFEECLFRTVDALNDLGVQVYILQQVPDQGFDVPRELAYRAWWGESYELGIDRATHKLYQKPLQEYYESFGEAVTFLNPADYLFDDAGNSVLIFNGRSLYHDEHHISAAGAEFISPLLELVFNP